MDPDLMGKEAGEVGSAVDHCMMAPAASAEGQPYSEERLTAEDHGLLKAGTTEHILAGIPTIPHETIEKQKAVDDTD
ncbi:hypothetical protein ABPG75_006197 [Micractinium tetrahymenae]